MQNVMNIDPNNKEDIVGRLLAQRREEVKELIKENM